MVEWMRMKLLPPPEPTGVAVAPAPCRPAGGNRQGRRSEALREALNDNALGVINAQAVQPACNQHRPAGYRLVLNKWKANNYDYFRHLDHAVKKRWQFKARFHSRLSVMEEIERLQRVEDERRDPTLPSCTLEEAADLLDSMFALLPLCFTKHLAEQRRENPNVDNQTRIRNTPANPPPAARRNFFGARAGVHGAQASAQGRQRAQQPRQQQQRPIPPAPPVDNGDAFAAKWAHMGTPAAPTTRQREREDITLNELAEEAAVIRAEQERLRTQGVLLFQNRGDKDNRNFNDMSRHGRDQYARRHLGPH